MSQLYTALKDFDGLEEIDRALGIPSLNQSLEQDQFQQDSMLMDQKPPMYSQQFAAPPSHLSQRGGYPLQDQGFHPLGGPMGPRPGYPMMRMQARPGLRPGGGVPNQPNALRLQLQHRLQSQQNRQPMMAQMSGVSNVNLPLRASNPNQGTINAQMLAQRQREYLSNHLRQRQQQQVVQQQRAMMMRTQGVPSGGSAPTPMPMGGTNPRLPQGNPQQFPYPASSYGTNLPSPPPPPPHPGSSSPFSSSPLSPSHHLASQGMMGNVGGQYSGVMSPPSQHSAYQFSSSAMSQQQRQDPVSGFPCGAATPQSPLLSPRMQQGQSPMMQQQNQGQPQNQNQNQGPNQRLPGYQPSSAWTQSANISTSNSVYPQQSQSQYSTQPTAGMYNNPNTMNLGVMAGSSGGNMNQMSGQMSSMNTEQVEDGSLILEQLAGMEMLTQESEASSNFC